MFRKTMMYLVAIGLCFSLSCSKESKNDDGNLNTNDPKLLKQEKLVSSAEKFGISLFKKINEQEKEKGENIFISPLSVSMALGMTLNGAKGTTKEEMIEALELSGLSLDEINATYRHLIDLLKDLDPKVIFEIANSIWYKEGYPVEKNFLEVNRNYFDAEVLEADFSAPGTLDLINGWVAEKTHDKIMEILDNIPSNAVMYLINAIYYYATWTYEFDKEKTHESVFKKPNGDQVTCNMMIQKNEFNYFESDEFQAVELPYGDQKYCMSVFLPKQDHHIDDFIDNITSEKWDQWQQSFQPDSGIVELPKFKTEYKLKLNDALKALGMVTAFGGGADFGKICPGRELYISRVLHKTFIDVDEKGTEAAAVTVVEIRETSSIEDPYFHMTVNRPFFFVIHEKESGTILFSGKIVEPAYQE